MAEGKSSQDRRPSSKALLELAAGEGRGKLKVFLGMAPGVGKTFAMLSSARALKAQGVDVVVGLIETHGRSETAAMLEGLPVLPRRTVPYRNRTLMEFDVDAAIARRPQLLLVDEFAHTNAPGLVHPKRYQDVEGVLQAGIDVWTTLNIQHLESLNDVVARITGVTVHETVPDKVLERADEVVVVDLPPEELVQRLKEGKVYLPENARRAIDQFFKPSNLTALRELALRRTADRVDEQMLAELRRQGIEGPWPTAERILVCVGSDDLAETVVRTAGRMAQAQKCDWIALNLRRSDRESTDKAELKRTDKAMRLAERLGATTVRLNSADLAADVIAYGRRNNITQIVLGHEPRGWLARLWNRSLADAITREAQGLSITLVTSGSARSPLEVSKRPLLPLSAVQAVVALAAVALAVGLGVLAEQVTPFPNISMLFLLAVLLSAIRYGVWTAVAASILSFFAYNFFFIDPRYTLTVAQPHELLSLVIFLVVAVATGSLAGRLHEQADATRERAETTQALYDFSRRLSGAVSLDDVIWLLAGQCANLVKGQSIVLLARDGDLAIEGGWPPEDELPTADWAAARWARNKREPAGQFTETMPTARFHFRPLSSSKGVLGVVGVAPDAVGEGLTSATESALQSFIDQAALAIERTRLVDQAAKAETAAEAERLRSSLLSSVSHDLKTPLASIVGSVTSLRQLGDRMPKESQVELLKTIEEEAQRLTAFVSNLLDMTRLEVGALDIKKDLVDVRDAVRGAVARAQTNFPQRKSEIRIANGVPPVRGDTALLEQVLFNLLDNANKYAGPKSVTLVLVGTERGEVSINVEDQGPGIPHDDLERVFEKFYRAGGVDRRAAGTGLGLSIAAGIIKAMGGTIRAESPIANGRGTRLAIRLPIASQATGAEKDTGLP